MSLSSLQVLPTLSFAIPIASRTDDGRDATSRPSGGDADDGDGEEDATAVPAVVQTAGHPAIQADHRRGAEPPA
ncbi:hypothetical protein CQ14_39705 [Bradyrhizobium lablabi]|uniref:Uncharacterized protein n=1 Tax=Bradyrhizobium lablabi TaxID=722472 RepID=A0A0R3MPW3_9BRAD|nr:hypothetical protein CQ14_39705 [Bradyrhizobium lablabi]